jgi:hypothetical protein
MQTKTIAAAASSAPPERARTDNLDRGGPVPDLPPEMWLHVHSFVPKCMLPAISRVCRQWESLHPARLLPAFAGHTPAHVYRRKLLREIVRHGYIAILRWLPAVGIRIPREGRWLPRGGLSLLLEMARWGREDAFRYAMEECWTPEVLLHRPFLMHRMLLECLCSDGDTEGFMSALEQQEPLGVRLKELLDSLSPARPIGRVSNLLWLTDRYPDDYGENLDDWLLSSSVARDRPELLRLMSRPLAEGKVCLKLFSCISRDDVESAERLLDSSPVREFCFPYALLSASPRMSAMLRRKGIDLFDQAPRLTDCSSVLMGLFMVRDLSVTKALARGHRCRPGRIPLLDYTKANDLDCSVAALEWMASPENEGCRFHADSRGRKAAGMLMEFCVQAGRGDLVGRLRALGHPVSLPLLSKAIAHGRLALASSLIREHPGWSEAVTERFEVECLSRDDDDIILLARWVAAELVPAFPRLGGETTRILAGLYRHALASKCIGACIALCDRFEGLRRHLETAESAEGGASSR